MIIYINNHILKYYLFKECYNQIFKKDLIMNKLITLFIILNLKKILKKNLILKKVLIQEKELLVKSIHVKVNLIIIIMLLKCLNKKKDNYNFKKL